MKKRLLILALCIAVISGCDTKEKSESKTYTDLGMECIDSGDYESAMSNFDAAEAVREDVRNINRGRGLACMACGDYAKAIEYFKGVLSLSEGSVSDFEKDVAYYLASSQFKSNDINGAIETYSNILALYKKDADAYYLRGCAYVQNALIDNAMKDFEKALEIKKDDFDMYIHIFECLNAGGYTQQGQNILNNALSSKACKGELQKGIIYYYLNDTTSALNSLTKAKEQNEPQALLYMGKVYELLENLDSAMDLYQEYLKAEENPKDCGKIYNTMGLCCFKAGSYDEAATYFRQGIEQNDAASLKELMFNEIVAYEYAYEFDRANERLKEYIAKYPDDETAQREYKFLSTR